MREGQGEGHEGGARGGVRGGARGGVRGEERGGAEEKKGEGHTIQAQVTSVAEHIIK